MKYFKSKYNFFSNNLKKNFLFKIISNFLRNFTLKIIYLKLKNVVIKSIRLKLSRFDKLSLKLNYLAFFVSIIFFSYLMFLTLPGIFYDKSDQNYLSEILKDKYNLNFSLSSNISYSILPSPHFKIKNVIIFNEKKKYQKQIAHIKELKMYLKQNNFFKKNNLKLKSAELIDSNFYIDNSDLSFLSDFFNKKSSIIPLEIKNSTLFYQDNNKSTISLISTKKASIFFNNKLEQKIFKSESEVYNLPFNVTWKRDYNSDEIVTNLKFDKIKLNIENTLNTNISTKEKKLQINLQRSKFITMYDIQNEVLNFSSINSFIGNNKFTYSGKIYLSPFSFDINAHLDKFDTKKLSSNLVYLTQIFNNEFALNQSFNGKIKLFLNNLDKKFFFDQITINSHFISNEIDLSKTIFFNNKILNLTIEKGNLYQEKDQLYFRGNLNLVIHNIDKFHNKFVVPKKNRVDLNSINVEVLMNLSNLDFKIINIKFDNNIHKDQESIDDLIYNFNNGSIKITNWIEFKNFTNNLISLYAG